MPHPVVAVFRQRLFAPSETFIPSQVESLPRFRGHYIARLPVHSRPHNTSAVSLSDTHKGMEDRIFALTGHSPSLTRALRESEAKIVHAHFGPDGMLASRTTENLCLPLIVTLHGRDVTVRRSELLRTKKPVAIRYAFSKKTLARRASRIICVSEHLKKTAIEQGFPAEKLITHYIGVDTDKFSVSRSPRTGNLLHVARLVEKKGTANLITAFSRIAWHHPDSNLDIVGDGPLDAALREQAHTLGLGHRIHFHGSLPHEEVRRMLSTAHAFVLPSVTAANGDREGLPISILEAMSTGTPVVSTYHSGIPEAIPSEEYGLLVQEDDLAALTDGLDAVLQSQGYASALGMAGARRVREHFNLRTQSEILENIYEDTLV